MLLVFLFLLGLCIFWFGSLGSVFSCFSVLDYDSFLSFVGVVDLVSLGCLFMLLCCGGIALFYCFHYFSGDVEAVLLFPLMVWFLGVMGVLVFSGSLLFSLVFWEYLGLVSFFLILFYSNMSSLRASLVTLFASRFGDVSVFGIIMWLSWWMDFSGLVFALLYLLVIMTKSACFPFISWLLEAMRAPTPVSSLVHSSTLVAAGVWFVLRYGYWSNWFVDVGLVYFCLITIIITAVAAIVFMDLKKIVALSTCNNVSWCILFFVCGDLYLALLQLVTHGLCKCYLFMSVGDLMGQSGSSQSSVGVFLGRYSGRFLPIVQSFLVISLCGLPFLGVFFSKHSFLSVLLYEGNLGLVLVSLLSLFLSYVYSVRFVLLLVSAGGGLSSGFASSFLLVCPLVFCGGILNYFVDLLGVEVVGFSILGSGSVLCIQVLGCLVGWWLYKVWMGSGCWSSLLWGNEGYVSLFYSWFMGVSSVCVVSFYRWEVYLLEKILGLDIWRWLLFRGSFFSISFMVLGLVYVVVLSYVL
uniref:NADH:ubiquinone reductase (H(+)-translocating) n=1 Tax=Fascioloides magna TaxID=394415 RepID=A0A109WVL9_9TREM|nr:NADH dehydrogenase subunit 5 [Fascioloides magna]AMF83652.1 NADH dehydrogenase subunit 5 [Fascioloides magna]